MIEKNPEQNRFQLTGIHFILICFYSGSVFYWIQLLSKTVRRQTDLYKSFTKFPTANRTNPATTSQKA